MLQQDNESSEFKESSRRSPGIRYCLLECRLLHIVSDLFRYMAPPLGGHDLMAEGTDQCWMHSSLEGGLFSLVYHPWLARYVQLVP